MKHIIENVSKSFDSEQDRPDSILSDSYVSSLVSSSQVQEELKICHKIKNHLKKTPEYKQTTSEQYEA